MVSPVCAGAEDIVAMTVACVDGVAIVVGDFGLSENAHVHVLVEQSTAGFF